MQLFCSGKEISIAYYGCVFVASGIQHAKRMRHIVMCGLSGCTVFLHIISQTAPFSGNILLNIKGVFRFFFTNSLTIFIVRRTERDVIKKLDRSSCTLPVTIARY